MQKASDLVSLLSFPLELIEKATGAQSAIDRVATRIALCTIAISAFGSWLYYRKTRPTGEPPKDVRCPLTTSPKTFRSVESAVTWHATDVFGINVGARGTRPSSADWLVAVQGHMHVVFGAVLGKGYALPEETLSVSLAHRGFRMGAHCQHFVPTFDAPDGWYPTYRMISRQIQFTYLTTPDGKKNYLAGVCFYLKPSLEERFFGDDDTSAAQQMTTFRQAIRGVRTWSGRCLLAGKKREKRVYKGFCRERQSIVWLVDSAHGKLAKFVFESRFQSYKAIDCNCY